MLGRILVLASNFLVANLDQILYSKEYQKHNLEQNVFYHDENNTSPEIKR